MAENKGILGKINKLIDKKYLKTLSVKVRKLDYDFTDKEKAILKRIIREDALSGKNSLSYTEKEQTIFSAHDVKMVDILEKLEDPDLTKFCLEMTKNQGHISKFRNQDLPRLLTQVNDQEYTDQYINEVTQLFNTSEQSKMLFISQLSELNEGKYDSYIKEKFKTKQQSFEMLDLPEGMTIGMEIEAAGQGHYSDVPTLYKWKSTYDKTIKPNGAEVVSPILHGTKKDVEEIYTTCNILKDIGMQVNSSCGGHIHIGADYLTSDEARENLIALWGNSEEILYKICNNKGDNLRGIKHANPISGQIEETRKKNEMLIGTYRRNFRKGENGNKGNRYVSMNWNNLEQEDKKTIEFRISNGSLEPEVWIQNANLYGGIVSAAEELALIEKKEIGQRTEKETQMLQDFTTLCTTECSEEQKLDILLKLAIKPENRYIYQERFAANSILLEKDTKLRDEIMNGVAKKPLTPKNIASAVFTGPNRVKGEMMEAADQRLARDVERHNNREHENAQEI